jgi:osmotically-inducible protein OsmY
MMIAFGRRNAAIKSITGLNPWARFILALAFFLAGCSGITGLKLGRYIDDKNLNASVQERFAAQKTADFAGVKTEVKDGVIYLSGTVASDEQRSRAENVAFQVPGTRGVINNLKVENP